MAEQPWSIVVALMALASPSWAAEGQAGAQDPEEKVILVKILALHRTELSPAGKTVTEILAGRDLRQFLLRNWRVENPQKRGELLELLARVAQSRSKPSISFFDMEVTSALVAALDDPDWDVQLLATRKLESVVDERAVRFFAGDIVRAARRSGYWERLLGKTGSPEARDMLLNDPRFRQPEAPEGNRRVQAALAKLGDTTLVGKVIKEFEECADPGAKAELAQILAYIGTKASCAALAKELRSPLIIGQPPTARWALRYVVIEALKKALPGEYVLWKPFDKEAGEESYYQQIEDWATRVLGVTWNQPRPPPFHPPAVPGRPVR